ncbi:Capsule polysaccharide export inner-membrane protein (plasmid) [Wenxinia marina DSM 24838]|uniref:Capsule polysaccharide export inner-membrane protein n=2 Tax=Wenxinia TaxID=653686 RepID=A0A0D0QGM9_9RHOB|nr:Capsule polysaccharide export inner-membrane protein [Wenxinia marina DSM 24838]
MVLLSFVLLVVGPTLVAGWYMWFRAADRYVSTAGFSVRTEEVGSAIELLGGIAQMSGSSSSDTDILYDYIQSQELVRRIDDALDLRAIWSRVPASVDPVFAYDPPGTIEDLTEYWRDMVRVYNDGTTGLLELRVQAFTPEDAQAIAQMIYDMSAQMINELSAIARADATGYAREELDTAVERLKTAREAITQFRNRTQIVDPAASIQSQMGILSSLQAQLAQTLVDLDLLRDTTNEGDPRIAQTENRIAAIESRIAEERNKLGFGTAEGAVNDGTAFADLVGEYERLIVDLQFAEQSYTAALATFDSSVAEARRQSRYLAAHVRPTLAEAPTLPRRLELTLLTALFAFLAWAILVLAAYAIRDRR